MTRLKSIFAGIGMGMIGLVLIGITAWHFLLSDSGPQILSRKWFCDSPNSLDRKTLSNDVWLCPDSPLIEPVAVWRVEWHDAALSGQGSGGYFVYYKARVADVQLSRHVSSATTGVLKNLPSWATHLPPWWKPESSIPSGAITQIDLQSDNVFIEIRGEDVFIYWIRAPFSAA